MAAALPRGQKPSSRADAWRRGDPGRPRGHWSLPWIDHRTRLLFTLTDLFFFLGLAACLFALWRLRQDATKTAAEKKRATIYVGIAVASLAIIAVLIYVSKLTFIPYPGASPTITLRGLLWFMPFAFAISIGSVFISVPMEANRVVRDDRRSPAYKIFRSIGLAIALVVTIAVMVHWVGR